MFFKHLMPTFGSRQSNWIPRVSNVCMPHRIYSRSVLYVLDLFKKNMNLSKFVFRKYQFVDVDYPQTARKSSDHHFQRFHSTLHFYQYFSYIGFLICILCFLKSVMKFSIFVVIELFCPMYSCRNLDFSSYDFLILINFFESI